jgi:transcriptional regulator with XRE-family HTH domain
MSTISKHPAPADLPSALGEEIRRLRVSRGLTQTQLGEPFTRAYVSAVERGRCTPSVVALLVFAARLQVPAGRLLDAVNSDLPARYNAANVKRGGALSRSGAHG